MTLAGGPHPFRHPVSFRCPAQIEVQEGAERKNWCELESERPSAGFDVYPFVSQHTTESVVRLCLPVIITPIAALGVALQHIKAIRL